MERNLSMSSEISRRYNRLARQLREKEDQRYQICTQLRENRYHQETNLKKLQKIEMAITKLENDLEKADQQLKPGFDVSDYLFHSEISESSSN